MAGQNAGMELPAQMTNPLQSSSPANDSQFCSVECACGKKVGAYVAHYTVVTCGRCGFYFWALRPARGGPLVLVAWPCYDPISKGIRRWIR